MSGLGRIMWKEIKELLTPGTLVPIIIMAVLFGMLGSAFGGVQDELQKKPELGLVLEDSGYLGEVAKVSLNSTSTIVFNSTSLNEGLAALKDGRSAKALIYVPGNFTSDIMNNQTGWLGMYWMKKGAGITESLQSSLVLASVTKMSRDISTVLIQLSITKNASLILQPVRSYDTTYLNEKEMSGVTPNQIDTVFTSSGFVVPLIVMLVIIMAGSMVISSMGSEKENKTLETLLTLPVKRSWIVFGKLAGATIVGLIMSFIYMIGLGYYYSSLQTSSPIDLAKFGLTLGLVDYILVGISLFLALLCGLALCMILGIFTKNFKAAQAMTLPSHA
jgi:ABC-2 type transport system permease protein